MPNPTGRYLCSDKTLEKANQYLQLLQTGAVKPGLKLRDFQPSIDFKKISPIELIALLINSKQPRIFAESEVYLGENHPWNLQEAEILGDITFSTTDTHAYNNGARKNPVHHDAKNPLETNFLFTPSALFKTMMSGETPELLKVLKLNFTSNKFEFDEDAFYELYENRLLPGLLAQNEQARKDGVFLVINIPGLGCGEFAGNQKAKVKEALPRVLKRLFETHGTSLDRVRVVNFDPYEKPAKDEFSTDKIPDTQIKLMCRPLSGLPKDAPGTVACQLEFPKDGTDYTNHRLIKIVAWDHFAYPGNDMWNNDLNAAGRNTDDGVSFASSDVILALFSMGQFKSDSKRAVEEVDYKSTHYIAYPVIVNDDETKKPIGYKELSKTYQSHVSAEMIEVISIPHTAKLEKTTIVAPIQSERITPKEVSTSKSRLEDRLNRLNAMAKAKAVAKKEVPREKPKTVTFIENKEAIQKEFMKHLQILNLALQECSKSDASIKDSHLIVNLTLCQNQFFKSLTPQTTKQELELAIKTFRESCSKHLEAADHVMGHGWLYRIAEVAIKAVVGLFVGIGMVLGSLFGQGLFKAEHRQWYAQTFFTLNQTDASQALNQFKKESENLDLLSLKI